ncbi:TBC1 domain family member 30-like isoform X2 [Dreissena polymorpha]|uniref:TBC1 domain family member 30-like isoform X2 n=1 Tax=Dreissena polymorpha TaxID=45954 RepID=UPI0022656DE7|nr:TBC1 domain family member 30-like isoform X2 [Dreissena polymorpha]
MAENPSVMEENLIENEQICISTNNPDHDRYSMSCRPPFETQSSIIDGLLSEIYDRWHDHRHDSFDSDTFTEYSSTSEFAPWRRPSSCLDIGGRRLGTLHRAILKDYDTGQLYKLANDMTRQVSHMNMKLVRQLKRRERNLSRLQTNCDIVTAFIQASSPKRQIDTRMKFSLEPQGGDSAFDQWKDAMKAVARLPLGIPDEFRRKVWLSLADQYICDMKIDWDKTVKFAFNERSNPDDNTLGMQIVKDLHRTGCSGFSGEDNEAERAVLKRILLAYARWNKAVGYCQGFNVIAALLLDVMDRKEADALKVMIFLIDHVLPQGYFANNLRALSVDMAVFRDLLKIFPKLSRHLDYLQHALDQPSGGCYEPPLTNVFTMQWFLTLFATCLPKTTVLRVWDSILLDGSEILLRTALVIWGKLSSRILQVGSADQFYTLMGDITQEMVEGNLLDVDVMIKSIYSIAPFPLQNLTELREKYTYNIRPFTPATKRSVGANGAALPSDEDDLEEEEMENITCFTGFIPTAASGKHKAGLEGDQRTVSLPDISSLGPGAYGMGGSEAGIVPAYMERMSTDIGALKKQYERLRHRQNQAHILINAATARQHTSKARPIVPTIETPVAMNHLFVNKQDLRGRNRFVAAGPSISNMYPNLTPVGPVSEQGHRHAQPFKTGDFKWSQKSPAKQTIERDVTPPSQKQVTKACAADMAIKKQQENGKNIAISNKDTEIYSSKSDALVHSLDTEECGQTANIQVDIERPGLKSLSVENTELDLRSDFKELCESDAELEEISRSDVKPTHSPLRHNDSGLGTSMCSSSVSVSSAESSPQHMAVLHGRSVDLDLDLKSVSEETLTVCSDINKSWSCDPSGHVEAEEKVGCDLAGEKSNGAMCLSMEHLIVSGADEVKSNFNEAEVLGCSNDRDESGVICDSRVSSTEAKISENNLTADYDTVKENKTDTSKVLQAEYPKPIGLKIKIPRSDSSHSKRSSVSDSSHGHISSHSNSCQANLPDVFSPDSKCNLSFQQYYINKRSMVAASSSNASSIESHLRKSQLPQKKAFNPFPVKHVNQNRAKTGIKLGLYKPSTLDQFDRNLKGQSVLGK